MVGSEWTDVTARQPPKAQDGVELDLNRQQSQAVWFVGPLSSVRYDTRG